MMEDSVYIFEAQLVDYDGVGCTLAVRASQTLEHLHRALRRAFGWHDDHLYSFWLSGIHWDGPDTEYTAPFELGETDARSAAVPLRELDLGPGRPIAYLFDFGDQWRAFLELRERVPTEPGVRYPKVLERSGTAPPQYA